MSEAILEQIVDELMQLGDKKFFKTLLMLNAITEKTKEINKENADLRAKLKAKDHTIELANGALKRAGSAARFGLKVNIPEGAMVFSDTAESMAAIPDVFCGCEALAEAQEKLKQYEFHKGVLTWWTYHCGHTIQKKYTEECPVCALHQAQEKIAELEETYTDIHGAIWEPPTSYAYAMICKAREKGRDREQVLREALTHILERESPIVQEFENGKLIGEKMFYSATGQIAMKALEQDKKLSTIIPADTPSNTSFANLVKKKFNQVI